MSNDNHTCEAAVLLCIDLRFHEEKKSKNFLSAIRKHLGIEHIDPIVLAGAAKNLASPEDENFKKVVLRNIEISASLHGTKHVVLTNHIDCGAYGGSDKFENREKEFVFHRTELERARIVLAREFPDLTVDLLIVYLEKNKIQIKKI